MEGRMQMIGEKGTHCKGTHSIASGVKTNTIKSGEGFLKIDAPIPVLIECPHCKGPPTKEQGQ